MGQQIASERLFHEIDSHQPENIKNILLQYPQLINEYFDSDFKCLPITKAAWLGYLNVLDMLIVFGADVNKKVQNGYNALFYGCERGHQKIIKRLLETKSCKIDEVDIRGFTALDISIIHGYYNCALLLVKKGLRPKSLDFYKLNDDYFVDSELDFEWFLKNLEEKNEFSEKNANVFLFKRKERITNGVFDPKENWGQFFRSMIEFSDPKVIPLKKLPSDFEPQKRKFNNLKTLINWRNQNYLENYSKEKETNFTFEQNKIFDN